MGISVAPRRISHASALRRILALDRKSKAWLSCPTNPEDYQFNSTRNPVWHPGQTLRLENSSSNPGERRQNLHLANQRRQYQNFPIQGVAPFLSIRGVIPGLPGLIRA
jgi:hypothetical protein